MQLEVLLCADGLNPPPALWLSWLDESVAERAPEPPQLRTEMVLQHISWKQLPAAGNDVDGRSDGEAKKSVA